MDTESSVALRQWGARIEQALGIQLGSREDGAFALRSKGGALVGVEPMPGTRGVALNGELGASGSLPDRTLRALLAVNLAPGLSGTGIIGLVPQTDALILRMFWTPAEPEWTEDAFMAVFTTFAEHVDSLAAAISSRDIERVLESSDSEGGSAPQPPHDTINRA
ncbi:type III secretion system chaperone [Castellaniella ginsengisoli]